MTAARNVIIMGLGVVLIVFGFVSLSAGSITLAPILLVAGYCVAIPIGLIFGVKRNRKTAGESQEGRANSSAG
ncbi:MAG: hypothetical protein JXB46_01875 [Candidatus Eisenbacteria bacterium]|nr:hypothetical protein [Candidatus Eisenbacteria bacterium]